MRIALLAPVLAFHAVACGAPKESASESPLSIGVWQSMMKTFSRPALHRSGPRRSLFLDVRVHGDAYSIRTSLWNTDHLEEVTYESGTLVDHHADGQFDVFRIPALAGTITVRVTQTSPTHMEGVAALGGIEANSNWNLFPALEL